MDIDLYVRAIASWGEEFQRQLAVGELNELAAALTRYNLGRENSDEVASEMADVYIMLEQVELMLGNMEQVEAYRSKKLERLRGRLEEREHGRN